MTSYSISHSKHLLVTITGHWCTINKNSETDIGIQPEDQKNKATSHWLLPLPQSKNDDPAFRKSLDWDWELAPPIL